mgnify:CR=1 FL=1
MDDIDQGGFSNQQSGDELLDARQAAELLGVKPATLYAYVSRGLLSSVAAVRGRGHRYARSEVMRAASVEWDERMRGRIFHAIFDANLKRVPGGTQQPLNDFKLVREFLYSPVLLGLMESPVSLVMLGLGTG